MMAGCALLAAAASAQETSLIQEASAGEMSAPCTQVLTTAYLPGSGECRVFPTPCAVPQGWKVGCESIKAKSWQHKPRGTRARNKLRELPKTLDQRPDGS